MKNIIFKKILVVLFAIICVIGVFALYTHIISLFISVKDDSTETFPIGNITDDIYRYDVDSALIELEYCIESLKIV